MMCVSQISSLTYKMAKSDHEMRASFNYGRLMRETQVCGGEGVGKVRRMCGEGETQVGGRERGDAHVVCLGHKGVLGGREDAGSGAGWGDAGVGGEGRRRCGSGDAVGGQGRGDTRVVYVGDAGVWARGDAGEREGRADAGLKEGKSWQLRARDMVMTGNRYHYISEICYARE